MIQTSAPASMGGTKAGVREHEGVALVEMRLEKGPRLFGERVDVVCPDVASPGHPHAVLNRWVARPAVCGSCRNTTSSGRMRPFSASTLARSTSL